TQLRSARLVRVERLLRFATLRGQPLGRVARTLLAVLAAAEPAATETVRLTILLVMPHRPAGRLRERDRDDLPAYLRQPGLELGLGREIRNRDHRRFDRTAVRARAPREHHPLERPDPRLDQVHVRDAAAPAVPRAVLLLPRIP